MGRRSKSRLPLATVSDKPVVNYDNDKIDMSRLLHFEKGNKIIYDQKGDEEPPTELKYVNGRGEVTPISGV